MFEIFRRDLAVRVFAACPILIVVMTHVIAAQNSSYEFPDDEYVVVTAIKANIRGTPDNKGEIVTTVNQGETYDQIAKKGSWYLIQTGKFAGWVHSSAIRLTDSRQIVRTEVKPIPVTRTVVRSDNSPFQSEYIGGDSVFVVVRNDSFKDLNLTFGGAKYKISAGTSMSVEIDEGTYNFLATAPGVRSLSGSHGFARGHRYTWIFTIRTI